MQQEFEDYLRLLSSVVNDVGTIKTRLIARDCLDCGLMVSTVYTADCGFETAILDAVSTYPVERDETEDLAISGHAKWVLKAPTLTSVVKLGYGVSIEEEVVELHPVQ